MRCIGFSTALDDHHEAVTCSHGGCANRSTEEAGYTQRLLGAVGHAKLKETIRKSVLDTIVLKSCSYIGEFDDNH